MQRHNARLETRKEKQDSGFDTNYRDEISL